MAENPGIGRRIRHELEYIGLRSVEILVPLLPWFLLKLMTRFAGWAMFYGDARTRKIALSNLDAVFGNTKTAKQKRQIAIRSMQGFARTMLELFWSPNFSREKYREYAEVEIQGRQPEHTAVYYCHHFGNFEWLSFASCYAFVPGIVIAQKFENPKIGWIFNRLRSLSGHEVIAQEKALLRMFKLLKSGGRFGVLTDLYLDPREGAVAIDAFGMKMCVTPFTGALVRRTGAKVVPCECLPGPDGRYIMRYQPPLEIPPDASELEITQLCWNALEPSIREYPECWLWGYKHWRLKPEGSTIQYPFYATTAGHLEKLLRRQGENP